ncbi:MAG TPA: TadE/TadG family type IV pilus assembly protein [Solirubrobacterales bacterium]|nr:TadE/TadG family type IV pilus assembly protein [Solirubrobacterales bacterium]
MRRNRAQDGQAAAELVAVAPILLCVVLALAQLAVAGYALWSAGDAARAGARAAHVGGDAERAALSALPAWLEDGAEVETAGPVAVTVRAPALLPGVPDIAVDAAAALDAGQAADG